MELLVLPSKYGGFETLAENLVKRLNKSFEITVFCSSKEYAEKPTYYNNARLSYINLKANGYQSILYDTISIFRAIKISETLLILGVSGCVVLPFVRLISKNKIIINIDGIEWKRNKWNYLTKLYLRFSEWMAVKFADQIVADNKVIQDYIWNRYNKNSSLIAYGGDHVFNEKYNEELLKYFPFLDENYAFKVCRIEPENNLHLIIDAFMEVKHLNLVIIGNWDANSYGRKLKEKSKNSINIFLLNPIYDQKLLNSIRSNCYIYLHGHSAGGTNPSLVEAMNLGLPIFAYGAEYNKETTKHKAKYFNNKMELVELIQNINTMELDSLSFEMKKIAESYYLWNILYC